MRIIAEIADAPLKSDEELIQTARRFYSSGASIIDLGMLAEAPNPAIAHKAVKTIRRVVPIPISIDSIDPTEINAGVEAGASFVLSLNQENMSQILPKLRTKATYTIIPIAQNDQVLPQDLSERIQFLEKAIIEARQLGYTQLVADPLIEPLIAPGTMNSLEGYSLFHKLHPEIHTVMGIGNITELLDADSPGVNALMAALASELEVTFLLSTEVGAKTRGAIQELFQAAQMMYLAKQRQVHPKDLGINLLMLKSKTFPEPTYHLDSNLQTLVQEITNETLESKLDPKGYFTIHLDRVNQKIVTHFYPHIKTPSPSIILKATTAQQLINAILKRDLISSLAHAAYLGQELTKAEIALVTSRPYIQEAPLFSY
jgi:dihydropteroate synthase-like protein